MLLVQSIHFKSSYLRWKFWITITVMFFAIMRSWGMMNSINWSRRGMSIYRRWGVNIWSRGNSHGMVGYMVMVYGLNNCPTTNGEEKYG